MRYALQLGIIVWITFEALNDPTVHEPLGQIVFFAFLVSYATVWLLQRLFRFLFPGY
jgi:hypothetical protein